MIYGEYIPALTSVTELFILFQYLNENLFLVFIVNTVRKIN